ncbi:hypothetical protein [Pedobacter sp. KLB.chiD]|uniref:hypothetical protein n=1 Tax=Pedobacter sp. KLB.chiD TaxID=3387402 RepID=UPI003999E6B2
MFVQSQQLVEINGRIHNVNASKTRIPYFSFQIEGKPGTFYNPGNGSLSLFKTRIIDAGQPISFKIRKADLPKINADNRLLYFAYNGHDLWIDLYYSIVRPDFITQFGYLTYFFLLGVANLICIYRHRQTRLFTKLFMGSGIFFFMMMLL